MTTNLTEITTLAELPADFWSVAEWYVPRFKTEHEPIATYYSRAQLITGLLEYVGDNERGEIEQAAVRAAATAEGITDADALLELWGEGDDAATATVERLERTAAYLNARDAAIVETALNDPDHRPRLYLSLRSRTDGYVDDDGESESGEGEGGDDPTGELAADTEPVVTVIAAPDGWTAARRSDGAIVVGLDGGSDVSYIVYHTEAANWNIDAVQMHDGRSVGVAYLEPEQSQSAEQIVTEAAALGDPAQHFDDCGEGGESEGEPVPTQADGLPQLPAGYRWDGQTAGSAARRELVRMRDGLTLAVITADGSSCRIYTIRSGESIEVNSCDSLRQAGLWLLSYLAAELVPSAADPCPRCGDAVEGELPGFGKGCSNCIEVEAVLRGLCPRCLGADCPDYDPPAPAGHYWDTCRLGNGRVQSRSLYREADRSLVNAEPVGFVMSVPCDDGINYTGGVPRAEDGKLITSAPGAEAAALAFVNGIIEGRLEVLRRVAAGGPV